MTDDNDQNLHIAALENAQSILFARRRAEDELRKESELFRVTLASIGDAVISADADGIITFLNGVAQSLTGWSQAQATGRLITEVFQIINEHTHQVVENPALQALRQGKVIDLSEPTLLISKNGAKIPIDDSGAPIRNNQGEIIGCVLVFRDVTERRNVEKKLSISERQFRTLADVIPQLAWMAHPNGDIFWYNQRWYEYTGKNFEDMQGWGWQSVHDPVELPQVLTKWRDSLETGKPFDMVFPLRAKDGTFRHFLTRTMPLLDDNGLVTRWFGTNTDISEARHAQEVLREAQSRLESTLAACEIGTWEYDVINNHVRADQNLAQMFGVTEEENASGSIAPYMRAIHLEDLDRVKESITQALKIQDYYEVEFRLMRSDSSVRWVVAWGRVEKDDAQRAIRLPGAVVDISSQRLAELSMRESEEFRRLALDGAELGSWHLNAASGELVTDARFSSIFGITEKYVEYEKLLEIVHPDDRSRLQESVNAAIRLDNPIPHAIEYRVIHQDGSTRWVFAKGRANFSGADSARKLVSFDGTVGDITERKRTEEERSKFVTLAENITDFIAMYDLKGEPFYINQAGMRMVGLDSLEEFYKTPLREFFFPEDQAKIIDEFLPAVVQNGNNEIEIRFRHFKTLTPVWMLYKAVALIDALGNKVGVACVSRDITQRRQLEDNLRKFADDLSEANGQKDEFLATLAHELRNPLAPIRNGLQLLKRSKDNSTVLDDTVALMERQLVQMVRLVDDLLDVSRITRGKVELRLQSVDLALILEQAIETSRLSIEFYKQELTVQLPPQPIYLNADAVRLSQVFTNLINNSCKYSDPGGHISIVVKIEVADVCISVRDTGIGISKEMLPKIFEMFTQVDRSIEKSEGGLGIGLTLVKRLIELHKGSVEATSNGLGQGSEFIVRLPILIEQIDKPLEHFSEGIEILPECKILVVDDNQDSATSLAMILELDGNKTQTAFDGVSALDLVSTFDPHVVLLDIGLPGLNGYEVAQRVRQLPNGRNIILVALTGWGQEQDISNSTEAGFNGHLVKPVDYEVLKNLLIELL